MRWMTLLLTACSYLESEPVFHDVYQTETQTSVDRRWHGSAPRREENPTSGNSQDDEAPSDVPELGDYHMECWSRVSCREIGWGNLARYGKYGHALNDLQCVWCDIDMCSPNAIFAPDVGTYSGFPQRRTYYPCMDVDFDNNGVADESERDRATAVRR